LAVVPIGRKPAVSGVLEAFSPLPYAFRNNQLELLEELAELILAAQRRAADSPSPVIREEFLSDTLPGLTWVETGRNFRRQASEALKPAKALLARVPKSWSAVKTWLAGTTWLAQRKWLRHSLLLAAVALLVFMGWLATSGKSSRPDVAREHQALASPASRVTNTEVASPSEISPTVHTRKGKTSPSSKVVMASKTDKAHASEDLRVRTVTEPAANTKNAPTEPAATPASPRADNAAENAPVLAASAAGAENALSGVLSAPATVPEVAVPVSKGLTEGALLRKIEPVYPSQARAMRLEGTVKLQATVAEDGTLHDIKVVSGSPLLSQAATQAVSRWRYRPYLLNGKPVAMRTEIKVEFKLP
jgi:TonB family protein